MIRPRTDACGPGVIHNFIKNSYLGCCLAVRREVLEVALPVLDAAGRVLLGDDACAQLTVLGWTRCGDAFTRNAQRGRTAAEAVTRVLIEVLRVAHPADLDWVITERS